MQLAKQVRLNKDTNFLKLIAIIAMLIDHCGKVFFPQYRVLRLIGRIAYPLFAYCCVVGCIYTKDFKKYLLRIGVLFLISQPFYVLAMGGGWSKPNILLSLFLGMLVVGSLHRGRLEWSAVALCVAYLLRQHLDYGFNGILLMILFYVLIDRPVLSFAVVSSFMILWGIGWLDSLARFSVRSQMYALMALPLIYLNTTTNIRLNKYVFYVFYPGHLLFIWIVRSML